MEVGTAGNQELSRRVWGVGLLKYIVSRYNVLTMAARTLTGRQYRSLAEFRYQGRRFLHFSERESRGFGLQPQHYQLLVALKGLPAEKSPTIGALAERMQLEHHSLVELLDRASHHGLVSRRRELGDRRRVGIHLTAKGEKL